MENRDDKIAKLQWQLNETLSALYETHISPGDPVKDCEICEIWQEGRKMLKESLH